jgi:hypothetical protein
MSYVMEIYFLPLRFPDFETTIVPVIGLLMVTLGFLGFPFNFYQMMIKWKSSGLFKMYIYNTVQLVWQDIFSAGFKMFEIIRCFYLYTGGKLSEETSFANSKSAH